MLLEMTRPLPSGTGKGDYETAGDISATRLSLGDPMGFPPHPREWLSIVDITLDKTFVTVTSFRWNSAKVIFLVRRSAQPYIAKGVPKKPQVAIFAKLFSQKEAKHRGLTVHLRG